MVSTLYSNRVWAIIGGDVKVSFSFKLRCVHLHNIFMTDKHKNSVVISNVSMIDY